MIKIQLIRPLNLLQRRDLLFFAVFQILTPISLYYQGMLDWVYL